MTRPIVELQRHGDIAVIVVDNPPVNTITAEVRAGLFGALEQVRADPTLRALVLRCAGNNFFTGADINEFSGPPKEAEYRDLFGRFEALPIPAIAAHAHDRTLALSWSSIAANIARSETRSPAKAHPTG